MAFAIHFSRVSRGFLFQDFKSIPTPSAKGDSNHLELSWSGAPPCQHVVDAASLGCSLYWKSAFKGREGKMCLNGDCLEEAFESR